MKKLVSYILTIIVFSCNLQSKSFKRSKKAIKKPNIILLLADDLGYGEIGCYGQKIIKTPVLDKLANKGMRFTNFYAGNSVCSPSRAVLLTGIQSSFNTIRGNSGYFPDEDKWLRVPLAKNEITIAEMLKKGGYQTSFIGKWHLGDANNTETWAHARGFDFAAQEQWAMRNGGKKFTHNMEYINGLKDSVLYEVDKWQSKDEFRTQLALQYLDTIDKEKPFFLFMSYRAPHGHEKKIGNKILYKDKGWKENNRIHAAKISLLDQQIGLLIAKLDQMGELDNTLIIFTSDNGPHLEGGHNPEFFNSNGKLKGYKRDLYEGGIRVPKIVYWKDKIAAGVVSNYISGFQDIMPTFAEIAGVQKPIQTNGISLLPVLKGKAIKPHNYLVWEMLLDGHWKKQIHGGFRQAVRFGQWKAVRYGVNKEVQLFNLSNDIGETNNIASKHPDIVKHVNEIFISERSYNKYFPYGGVTSERVEIKKR
ncbi:MAG: arylsulfatase [Tenacibaculum sp.]